MSEYFHDSRGRSIDVATLMNMPTDELTKDSQVFSFAIKNDYFDLFYRLISSPKRNNYYTHIILLCNQPDRFDYMKHYVPVMTKYEIIHLLASKCYFSKKQMCDIINLIFDTHQFNQEDKKEIGYYILNGYGDYLLVHYFLGENFIIDRDFIKKYNLPNNIDQLQFLLDHGLDEYVNDVLDEYAIRTNYETIDYLIEKYRNKISFRVSINKYIEGMVSYDDTLISDINYVLDGLDFLVQKGFTIYSEKDETKSETMNVFTRLINFFNQKVESDD